MIVDGLKQTKRRSIYVSHNLTTSPSIKLRQHYAFPNTRFPKVIHHSNSNMATATISKFRLVFTTPVSSFEACKTAIFAAGGGRYPNGKYTECCWSALGNGQFRPGDAANPHTGAVGRLEHTQEIMVEIMCFGEDVARKAVTALKGYVCLYFHNLRLNTI